MRPGLAVLGIVALAVILALGWFVSVGNGLVARELAVRGAWAQVENVYQRRADLVPNLVEVVKGFAAQERAVLEEVTRARASVAGIQVPPEALRDPEALRSFQEAQAQLGGALGRLLAVVERYPDLRSNRNFLALQSQLEGTENRIAVERRRYNEAVRDYNTAVTRFPGSLVAALRGFSARRYFEASPGAEAPPAIKFQGRLRGPHPRHRADAVSDQPGP